MKTTLTLVFVALFSSISIAGDIIVLNNEMVFEGTVKSIKHCSVKFKTTAGTFKIPAGDILMLKFENPENNIYVDYLANQTKNPCLEGQSDAIKFHGKRGGHFVLGFLFGPFAILGTALSKPTPYRGSETVAFSKNEDLFDDPVYLKCYKKKAKSRLIGMELAGWGSWLVIWAIISAAS